MAATLFAIFTLLGATLMHWAHSGIEPDDHEKRVWARTMGPIIFVVSILSAIAALVFQKH